MEELRGDSDNHCTDMLQERAVRSNLWWANANQQAIPH